MDHFLAQTFSIPNHPIRRLKETFQTQYVLALGEFLCYITNNDKTAKLVFEIWSQSIIGKVPQKSWAFTHEFVFIRDGLAIHRDGFKFFTMRQSLLFDCFYLLEKSGKKDLLLNAYTFLVSKIGVYFTKKIINYAYDFFNERNSGDRFHDVLIRHRLKDRIFSQNILKRVLVVATMSAGKSTIVNALVGHRINQVRATACTSQIHYIYNKPVKEGAMAHFGNRKFAYSSDYSIFQTEVIDAIGIHFASSLERNRICLIDTPGVNYNGDAAHGQITKNIIQQNKYDILLLVLNGLQLAINDEKDLVEYIGKHCKRKIICVVNQCDSYRQSQDSIEDALEIAYNMLAENNIKNPIVLPVSGLGAFVIRQMNEPKWMVDEDDSFYYKNMVKILSKPYYNLPSYIPGVPKDVKIDFPIERTGIPYLEHLISHL